MENILLPSKIETKKQKDNKAEVVIEPLYMGYGTTLGNALRRVLLSSLPGAAISAFKIKGVFHEFSEIPHVKEDVVEILLNLKKIRLKIHGEVEEPIRLTLKTKGDKKVTAGDIDKVANVEIVNPDLHIATLTNKVAEFDMEIFAEKGRGYKTTEARGKKEEEIGVIAIDSIFNPVKSVGFKVENTRVGQITNYDKLTLNIETDGTLTPEDALSQAVKILVNHFKLILGEEVKGKKKGEEIKAEEPEEETEEKEEKEEKKEKKAAKKTKKTAKATETKKKRGRPKKK